VEQVILVDKEDCEIGVMEKMEAHKQPILHRAFSIFFFIHRVKSYYNKGH